MAPYLPQHSRPSLTLAGDSKPAGESNHQFLLLADLAQLHAAMATLTPGWKVVVSVLLMRCEAREYKLAQRLTNSTIDSPFEAQ